MIMENCITPKARLNILDNRYYFTQWFSLIILKICNSDELHKYRELERIKLKIVRNRSHLCFNETCINNKLLPTYTKVSNQNSII